MDDRHDDTVFALASGMTPSAVAVVRISGPGVVDGMAGLVGTLPDPRRMTLRTLRDAVGAEIDRVLVVYFPAPASFDGNDAMELHLHGGPAVVERVLEVLGKLPGFRMAEAGEFTRRAFENGKLGLAEVEGLADLVAAETEVQRAQALARMSGRVSNRVEAWRERLVRARAMVEAVIDFADEEDVPEEVDDRVRAEIAAVRDEISAEVASRAGERVREGCEIVVVGPPNAGKSSLVNALARRDVAIVSDIPGTTRDLIEVRLDLDGVPATVVDTAGLRAAAADAIEREGMDRALRRAEAADLRIALVDLSDPAPSLAEAADLVVGNKADLLDGREVPVGTDLAISVATGAGVDRLVSLLADRVRGLTRTSGEGAVVTRARHRAALGACVAALDEAVAAGDMEALELQAEALRHASDALGRITGRVDVEDLLDVIFRDFCVGK